MSSSTLVHEKFLAIVAQAKEEEKQQHVDIEDLYHGRARSDPIISRAGRIWYIQMDTCYGHYQGDNGGGGVDEEEFGGRMSIVPGRERSPDDDDDDDNDNDNDESESEPNAVPKIDGRALFKSAVTKARLMNIAGLMMAPPNTSASSRVKVSMVSLIEDDDDPDPSLNIPIYAPLHRSPLPIVEMDDDGNETETTTTDHQQQREKRGSGMNTTAAAATSSSIPHESNEKNDDNNTRNKDIDDGEGDDDNDEDLLEGFGARPERRSVHVRKFVRRNKFLKKVFRGRGSIMSKGSKSSSSSASNDHIHIDDDYYE